MANLRHAVLGIIVALCGTTSLAGPPRSSVPLSETLYSALDVGALVMVCEAQTPDRSLDALPATAGLQITRETSLGSPGWYLVLHETRATGVHGVDSLIELICASPDIRFVAPVFGDVESGWTAPTQDILIRFRDGYAERALELITELAPSLEVIDDHFGGMPGALVLRTSTSNGFEVMALADELAGDRRVKWAEPDMKCSVSPDTPDHEPSVSGGLEDASTAAVELNNSLQLIPNDPLFAEQWAHLNTGQFGGTPGYDADADLAWDITTGSPEIKILVLDDGVQLDHPDLNVLPGVDFTTDPAGNSGAPVNECDNHGTAVAGMIAAIINNGIGVVGIAPDCKVLTARTIITLVQDPCTRSGTYNESWIINALDWGLAQGARISNHSYGSTTYFNSSALEDQFNRTYDSGMVHFASTGNQGSSVIFPARFGSVNAVSAMTRHGDVASWSNFGPEVSICAPGAYVRTTDRTGADGYSVTSDYCFMNGTSASAPYAAGVAALMLSVDASWMPAQVEATLHCSARDLGDPGFDDYFGYGLVNAHRAVMAITADMNCDGWFDLADVVLVGNVLDGLIDLTGTCGEDKGDVDMDGDLDEDDYESMFDLITCGGT